MADLNGTEHSFEFPGRYYEIIRGDFRDLEAETGFFASYLPSTGGSVVDIGCGTGTNLRELDRIGHACTGLDQSAQFIEHARGSGGGVTYHHGRINSLDLPDESVDLVFAVFVTLNYFGREELYELIHRVRRWLAPNGRFIVDIGHMLNFVDNYQPYIVAHHRAPGILITRFIRHEVRPHRALWRHEETILVSDEGRVSMYENFFDQLVLTAPEIEHLLHEGGLKVRETFGDFRKSPAPRSGRGHLILVAGRDDEL